MVGKNGLIKYKLVRNVNHKQRLSAIIKITSNNYLFPRRSKNFLTAMIAHMKKASGYFKTDFK